MTRLRTLATAAIAVGIIGCADFLSGSGITSDPNAPSSATPEQLWIGSQNALIGTWDGYFQFWLWSDQQVAVSRTPLDVENYAAGVDQYWSSGYWDPTYGPGGLRDLRLVAIGAMKEEVPNPRLRGVARVAEALRMGTLADIFGDAPYSDALTPHPKFDRQSLVYAHVLALLDSAIVDLQAPASRTAVPDSIYHGDMSRWVAAAHTMKARFLMHTVRRSAVDYDPSILTNIITEATSGIASEDGDFKTFRNAVDTTRNCTVGQATDVLPSDTHIALIKEAGELFLMRRYYCPNNYGEFFGTAPGSSRTSDSISTIAYASTLFSGIVSFAENEMLLAEAQYRLGRSTAAESTLDAYRSAIGAASLAPVAGNALLEAILREKFIHGYPNLEAWADYLRTCYPNFPLPPSANLPYVPARMPVSYTEQTTNPANVPPQPPGNPGNANDPKNDVAIDGVTACYGQVARPY